MEYQLTRTKRDYKSDPRINELPASQTQSTKPELTIDCTPEHPNDIGNYDHAYNINCLT